jgi:hypothetical protein
VVSVADTHIPAKKEKTAVVKFLSYALNRIRPLIWIATGSKNRYVQTSSSALSNEGIYNENEMVDRDLYCRRNRRFTACVCQSNSKRVI